MLKKIFIVFFCFMVMVSDAAALTDEKYNKFIQRSDFKTAEEFLSKSLANVKSLVNMNIFNQLLNNQRNWIKSWRTNEVQYLYNRHPFYDEIRMYAISTMTRALFLKWICDYIEKK